MIKKIIEKLTISSSCFVCGDKNECSLKTEFFRLEDDYILAVFKSDKRFESFPNRIHGGIISAVLDETAGRIIQFNKDIFAVTTKLETRFILPTPVDTILYACARIDKENRLMFQTSAILFDKNKKIYAKSNASFLKLEAEKIVENGNTIMDNDLHLSDFDINIEYIDIPEF